MLRCCYICRFPGEPRCANLGMDFGKHGALILASRSYVKEATKHKHESKEAVRNSRKKQPSNKRTG